MDFYESYNYLERHPMFHGEFQYCLDIEVVKVNPKTNSIDDDERKNTKTAIWLECGPWMKDCRTHDIDLDCGGDSFEEAIINLAKLVKKYYGRNYNGRIKDKYC